MDAMNRFSVPQILAPIDTVSPIDWTAAAAATVLGTFIVAPSAFLTRSNNFQTGWEILGLMARATQTNTLGGTPGVVGLFVNGVESAITFTGSTVNWSRLTNVAGAKGTTIKASVESNLATTSTFPGSTFFASAQVASYFPNVEDGAVLEVRQITQGVGGTQTYQHFLIVRGRLLPTATAGT